LDAAENEAGRSRFGAAPRGHFTNINAAPRSGEEATAVAVEIFKKVGRVFPMGSDDPFVERSVAPT